MEKNKEYIQTEMERLAKSYIPEWHFNTVTPDIGSVIGMIYAEQMAWNMEAYKRLPQECFREFLEQLRIRSAYAQPAEVALVLEVDDNLTRGIDIKQGSRFFGNVQEKEEPLIFRTSNPIHAVPQRLIHMLAVSASEKKIVLREQFPVRLFDYEGKTEFYERVFFKHPILAEKLSENFKLHFKGTKKGVELDSLFADREQFGMVHKPEEQAIVLERKIPSQESISIAGVSMTAEEEGVCPQFIYDGSQELDLEQAQVFGEELQLYKECYIGQDHVFAQKDAQITMTFSLEFIACDLQYPEPEEELKLIKKQKKVQSKEPQVRVYAQKVSLSYFNGQGFRKLECKGDVLHMFDAGNKKNNGEYQIQFICPKDWERMTVGGYDTKCIRIQVVKADQCYVPGGIHFCPVLHRFRLAYSYEENVLIPEKIVRQRGSVQEELTDTLGKWGEAELFTRFPYEGNYMLFGFDQIFREGPVSLYFVLESRKNAVAADLRFEYSSNTGFRPLEVQDHTSGFSASGTISFYPPEDMAQQVIEGKRACWIRVRCGENVLHPAQFHPQLERVYMNGVEAWNVEETELEDYNIDESRPNMSFPVRGDQIIDAEVWVNERYRLTDTQMKEYMEHMTDRVQAEYDFKGNISEFYVKWEETEDFEHLPHSGTEDAQRGARYYILDRKGRKLRFGDGSKVQIPQYTRGTAFRVKIFHCAGSAGNVDAGVVTESASRIMFLKRIYNPLPAVGGSDMEREASTHRRGRNLLSTGGRLVTKRDYIREAMDFSKLIEQAEYVEGVDGSKQIILLMKDYEKGSRSFWQIKKPLLKHLLERGDMCRSKIDVVEPIFVAVSVELWMTVTKEELISEIKEDVKRCIRQYLCPLKTERSNGWKIGMLPERAQIEMMLYSIKTEARIRRYHVSLSYTDQAGEHLMDLDRIKNHPFFVCTSGEHKIHVTVEGM